MNDVFEIKEGYMTRHELGVIAVLDRVLTIEPTALMGKIALVSTPDGKGLHLRIDEAKDHGMATSLFFKGLTSADIPVGSRIIIEDERK